MRAGQEEVNNLSRELRYTQQTVAMELAGWQDMHERMGRKAIRELARSMVVVEKMRLAGFQRALRKLKEPLPGLAGAVHEGGTPETGGETTASFSIPGPPIALAGLEMVAANREGDSDADLPVSTASAKAPPPPKEIIEDTAVAGVPSVQTANGLPTKELPGLPQAQLRRGEDVLGGDEGGSASGQVARHG